MNFIKSRFLFKKSYSEEQTKEAEREILKKLGDIISKGEIKKELFNKLCCTKNLHKVLLSMWNNAIGKLEEKQETTINHSEKVENETSKKT